MAKELKTNVELEKLVMSGIKSIADCKGATGVIVNRTATSWTVDQVFGATPACQAKIGEIVTGLRAKYDLAPD